MSIRIFLSFAMFLLMAIVFCFSWECIVTTVSRALLDTQTFAGSKRPTSDFFQTRTFPTLFLLWPLTSPSPSKFIHRTKLMFNYSNYCLQFFFRQESIVDRLVRGALKVAYERSDSVASGPFPIRYAAFPSNQSMVVAMATHSYIVTRGRKGFEV